MNEKTTISMRIDKELKDEVSAIFKDFGLNMTTATILFYKQVIKEKNIPFTIGNPDYINRIRLSLKQAEKNNDNMTFENLDEFKKYYEELKTDNENDSDEELYGPFTFEEFKDIVESWSK